MSVTWQSQDTPPTVLPRGIGWGLVILRFVPILVVLGTGLGLMVVLRLVEAPLCRPKRPVTPWITVVVCRLVLRLLGLGHSVTGQPSQQAALLVSNHVSWLDIFVLNAVRPLYFVAKSEVAGWPGISWLAKATGTVFISRDRAQAKAQAMVLATRLRAGHRLLLFPEGTSTDGQRVLRFRSSMFAAAGQLDSQMQVQPISVVYRAPKGADPRFYGWWGDMEMGPSLLQVLAARPQGHVDVIHHDPIQVCDHKDRKALAAAAELSVRAGLEGVLAVQ